MWNVVITSLISDVSGASSASDMFELVGNGFCVDAVGRRLKLGPRPETHSQDLRWQKTEVSHEGRAQRCEQLCLKNKDCIGYMTEDSAACVTIRRSDHNAKDGIVGADDERRNYCWERVPGAAADDGCEVYAIYADGRREKRECVTLTK